jgi:hypothetical protein
MNANKRIEEFIIKLIIRQNDPALFNIIDELTLISRFNISTMSAKKFYNKHDNKLFSNNYNK